MAVNHLVFQGRNVRDLELKTTQSGIENVKFTLAWSEKYKETERKCFLTCKAWRQMASFLDRYFHSKGSEMVVEGALETEEWEDKDGNKRSQIVLNVDKVHFCGKKQDNGSTAQTATNEVTHGAPAVPAAGYMEVDSSEPLPF